MRIMSASLLLFLVHWYLCECDTHMEPNARIINGIPTTGKQYAWIVSIQWEHNLDPYRDRNVACSGSLIRSTYPVAVLTAGHCAGSKILGATNRIYYGDFGRTYPYKANQTNDTFVTLRAFYYYMVSEYDTQPIGPRTNLLTDYDLAIILFDGSVDIEPITLYDSNNMQHINQCCEDGQIVRAFGYGYLNDQHDKTETLRYLDMDYMSDVHDCSQRIVKCVEDNDGFSTKYTDNVIDDGSAVCALSDAAGICQGDSGGPLVFIADNNTLQLQIGVGSQSCCIAGVPNMFATVTFFYDIIQQSLADQTGWQEYVVNTTGTDIFGDDARHTYEYNIIMHIGFCVLLYVYLC